MGTADLACPSLRVLAAHAGCEIVSVLTQPDRAAGRGQSLHSSPIKQCAMELGLPVFQPVSLRNDVVQGELIRLQPALVVVVAYGLILPPQVLELPKHGCLNVHASLLPRHRGAAPIQWAILEGDTETGVTIMKMDEGLDTGAIISMEKTVIEKDDTSQLLHDRLAQLGAKLLIQSLPGYLSGEIKAKPQSQEGVTYARKITKDDGCVDWGLPAEVLQRRVQALIPWPGAFTSMPFEEKPLLKIWESSVDDGNGVPGTIMEASDERLLVACGEGALGLSVVQREGARKMPFRDFLRGCSLKAGMVLGKC